jgi:hypothetical protein
MIVRTVTLTSATGASVTLGRVAFAAGSAYGYTLDRADLSPAPREPRKQALPLVGGGVVTPGRRGIRTVELDGQVIGRTPAEANALARQLVALVGDEGDDGYTTVTYTPEGTTVALTGTLDGPVDLDHRGGSTIAYRLRLVCPDPLAYAVTGRTVTASAAPGTAFTANGNAEVWPRIEVVATGTVTGLRVGNTATGRFVQLDGLTLTTGQAVVIDTRPGYEAVTVNGVNGMGKRNANSRWPSFVPGANRLYATVLGGGGTVAVTATFRDGWAS